MPNKGWLTALLVAFIVGLAGGYRLHSQPSTSETDKSQEKETNHTVRTVVTTHQQSGDTRIVETTDSIVVDNKLQTKTSLVLQPVKRNNVSALAGIDAHTLTPIYGISATRQLVGPITAGAFALTNGVLGLSVGISF